MFVPFRENSNFGMTHLNGQLKHSSIYCILVDHTITGVQGPRSQLRFKFIKYEEWSNDNVVRCAAQYTG